MSAAIVHFAAGTGTALIAITLLYRAGVADLIPRRNLLAYAAGIWGLGPDIHHVTPHDGLAAMIYTVHNHRISDVFFLHWTLDRPYVEAYYHEMIGVGIAYIGLGILVAYVFGVRHREQQATGSHST